MPNEYLPNESRVPEPDARTVGLATDSNLLKVATDPAPITIKDTLLGTDPPIEKAHPGLQPALVFASYPLALIVLISIVAIYFVFFRSTPRDGNNAPTQVESTK